MPSQSRWEGEVIPAHWIWTESPDLVKIFGVSFIEGGEEFE